MAHGAATTDEHVSAANSTSCETIRAGTLASIRKRTRADGTTAVAVLYSFNGQQTSATFDTVKAAAEFRDAVNSIGAERAMKAWGIAPTQRAARHSSGPTVAEYLNTYIDGLTGKTKATLFDYRSYVRNDITPVLGAIPLADLSSDDIARWVKVMEKRGATTKSGAFRAVSGKTLANKHGFLSGALNAAAKRRPPLIPFNPAAGVDLPKTERPDMVFLSRDDFAALLAEIPARWQPLTEFLVASGARFGEVTALRPADVERARGTVRIHRAWKRTYAKGGYELGPPKTKKSRRTISVAASILDRLDYSREWLFTTASGGPVRVGNFRANVWWPALQRAKLDPRPRIHDLRHTHASWLIGDRVPLPVIQRRMGHESIQVTVDVYGHLDSSADEAAAESVDPNRARP